MSHKSTSRSSMSRFRTCVARSLSGSHGSASSRCRTSAGSSTSGNACNRNSISARPSQTVRTCSSSNSGAAGSFDAPPALFHNHSLSAATALTKAYLYYPDAWWYTKLNVTVGQWPKNAFLPLHTKSGVWVGIHWNDGLVTCTSAGAPRARPVRSASAQRRQRASTRTVSRLSRP